jgi:D-xylose transport system permease protein
MTDLSTSEAPTSAPERGERGVRRSIGSLLRTAEIDTRLLGMIVALVVIWVGFHIMTGGGFITPRNLWNLSVQTSVVAIMATGMVLIIVSRNIDLSVGSMLGLIGISMAVLQSRTLPELLGFGHPAIWVVTLIAGVILGAILGAFQGFIVAYVRVPAFIVTLGGLLAWRGVAWSLVSGQTVAPMDTTFRRLGGGSTGSIGEFATWVFAIVACAGIAYFIFNRRRQRRKYAFALRPVWAEVALGAVGFAAVLGGIAFLNRYYLPESIARQRYEEAGIPWPPGGVDIPLGIAIPVVIALGVALVMTIIANRRRFGRYVFSIGGNPEAAELAGINTRRTIVKTFMVMGILVAIAAAVSIARLNAATSGLGTLSELYVIAAAVIGGTSFAGGIGTIPGAVLGALVMQSLQSGMVLMRVDAPLQDVVVGIVLVVAVAIDMVYRQRAR